MPTTNQRSRSKLMMIKQQPLQAQTAAESIYSSITTTISKYLIQFMLFPFYKMLIYFKNNILPKPSFIIAIFWFMVPFVVIVLLLISFQMLAFQNYNYNYYNNYDVFINHKSLKMIAILTCIDDITNIQHFIASFCIILLIIVITKLSLA